MRVQMLSTVLVTRRIFLNVATPSLRGAHSQEQFYRYVFDKV
jgi:hypothetical protein